MAYSIIETCIGCTACTKRCPTNAISGDRNELHVIDPSLCIGSGCELCINICPFDALSLEYNERVDDFFGVSTVDEKKCTGCRLCEDVCGWDAVHIFPLKDEMQKSIEALTDQEIQLIQQAKKGQNVTELAR